MSAIEHKWILRGAAGVGGEVWSLPVGLKAAGDLRGGDALGDLALRVLGMLVAGMTEAERAGMGIVVGTTLGCLEMDRAFDRSRREAGGRYASPAAFSRTLPSTVAAEMALAFGVKGPSLVVSAGDCSTAMAIRRAVTWMDAFELQYCVAGGMDWVGEEVRVGMVLLGRSEGVGRAEVGKYTPVDLAAIQDGSVGELIKWVWHGGSGALRAGVQIVEM